MVEGGAVGIKDASREILLIASRFFFLQSTVLGPLVEKPECSAAIRWPDKEFGHRGDVCL